MQLKAARSAGALYLLSPVAVPGLTLKTPAHIITKDPETDCRSAKQCVPTRVTARKIGGRIVKPRWRVTTVHGILKAAGIRKNRIHGRGKKNVAAVLENNPNVP